MADFDQEKEAVIKAEKRMMWIIMPIFVLGFIGMLIYAWYHS